MNGNKAIIAGAGPERWVITNSVKSGIQVAKVPPEQHDQFPVGGAGVYTDFQAACEKAAMKCLERSDFYITQGKHWATISKKTHLVGIAKAVEAAPAVEGGDKKGGEANDVH